MANTIDIKMDELVLIPGACLYAFGTATIAANDDEWFLDEVELDAYSKAGKPVTIKRDTADKDRAALFRLIEAALERHYDDEIRDKLIDAGIWAPISDRAEHGFGAFEYGVGRYA